MRNQKLHWLWLACSVAMFTLGGCFQPAGASLEATSLAGVPPTYTPIPSETPTELPTETGEPTLAEPPTLMFLETATETPSLAFLETATDIPTETPTLDFLVTATPISVADAALVDPVSQDIDPIWLTATAIFLENSGQIVPTFNIEFGTATQLVVEATQTAEFPFIQQTYDMQTAVGVTFAFPTADPNTQIQPTAVPVFIQGNDCIHEVRQEDRNLYRLGLDYGINYLDIAYYAANRIVNPNLIFIGQRITIPGCGTTGKIPPATSTSVPISEYPTAINGGGAYPTFSGSYPTFTGSPINYIVQPGDTLFGLSLSYGLPIATIQSRNPQITNPNLIYIGDTLVIG